MRINANYNIKINLSFKLKQKQTDQINYYTDDTEEAILGTIVLNKTTYFIISVLFVSFFFFSVLEGPGFSPQVGRSRFFLG